MYHGEVIKKTLGDQDKYYRFCVEHGEVPILKFFEDHHQLCLEKPKNGGALEMEEAKPMVMAAGAGKIS